MPEEEDIFTIGSSALRTTEESVNKLRPEIIKGLRGYLHLRVSTQWTFLLEGRNTFLSFEADQNTSVWFRKNLIIANGRADELVGDRLVISERFVVHTPLIRKGIVLGEPSFLKRLFESFAGEHRDPPRLEVTGRDGRTLSLRGKGELFVPAGARLLIANYLDPRINISGDGIILLRGHQIQRPGTSIQNQRDIRLLRGRPGARQARTPRRWWRR